MKKKWIFVLSVAVEILLVLLSWYLANQYEAAYQMLNYAAGAFFLSVFFLFNCKDADKPLRAWGPYDSVKAAFEDHGKLHLYKYWANAVLLISLILGFVFFFIGVVKIFT